MLSNMPKALGVPSEFPLSFSHISFPFLKFIFSSLHFLNSYFISPFSLFFHPSFSLHEFDLLPGQPKKGAKKQITCPVPATGTYKLGSSLFRGLVW